MKRLLICLAAIAFWAVDQTEVAAQSGTRTGSYQSILNQAGGNGFGQGALVGNGYSTPAYQPNSQPVSSVGYPGITAGQQSAPVMNQLAPPMQSAPMAGGSCNNCTGSSVQMAPGMAPTTVMAPTPAVGGGYDAGGYVGGMGYTGYAGAPVACDAPVYTPAQNLGAAAVGSSRNWFYGLNGLIFNRDFEDDVFLTRDPVGNSLLSTDADTNTLGGLEFFMGSRNCSGNGFEARYWGLFSDEATATLTGATYETYLTELQDIIHPTSGDNLRQIFDRSTTNTITRDNEIHNVEFNFLRRGGCFRTRGGRCANYELLHGFRWFEFNEEFHWDAASGVAPTAIFFDTDVRNTLLGYQIGGRSNICLTRRMAFNVGTKVGIFNNRARADQQIFDQAGIYGTVGPSGVDYDFQDSKNDIAMLGELDLGVSWLMSQCSRLNLGYRAIGVSGLALAPDQYSNFNTPTAIRDVQTNGSLLLHGAYVGFEFCR